MAIGYEALRRDLTWALACLHLLGSGVAAADPLLDRLCWTAAERQELAPAMDRLLLEPRTPEEWVAHDAVAAGRGLPVHRRITPMGVRLAGRLEDLAPDDGALNQPGRTALLVELADRATGG